MLINFLRIVSFPSSVTRQPAAGRREKTSRDGKESLEWEIAGWEQGLPPKLGDALAASGPILVSGLGMLHGLGVPWDSSHLGELGCPQDAQFCFVG